MATNWDAVATQAQQAADDTLKSKISSLTRLTDKDITDLIEQSGISQTDLVLVLKALQDTTLSNDAKAKAIRNIGKGLNLLVGIAGKII